MDKSKEEMDKIVEEKKTEIETEGEVVEEKVPELQNEEQIVEENNIQVVEEANKPSPLVKKNKLLEAQELIENSKELVSKVETEIEESKNKVSAAAQEFDEAKRNFNSTTFKSCETILEKLGFDYVSSDELEPFELAVDEVDKKDFYIKDISSGRFTGFILALLGAILTALGLIYLALTKLNIDPTTITSEKIAMEKIAPVLNWIGTFGGHTGGDAMIGATILGFASLFVAWLVYAIRVNTKANKNLRIAKETHEKTKEYCVSKEDSKKEIKKIDAHLREMTNEINNFDTILNEKLATLKRVLHIEGAFDEDKEYHPSSRKTMRETEKIMQGIENLLNTAVTKEGKLNSQSVQALNNAKAIYNDYLARIYD